MKKKIWPTRNLYFQHVDPEQLKLHEPKPTRSEAAEQRRTRTNAAWGELEIKKQKLNDALGRPVTRTAVKQQKKRPGGGGDWHVMNNDK
jgi:hypothetical protein